MSARCFAQISCSSRLFMPEIEKESAPVGAEALEAEKTANTA
jgi:hypothetical protein